MAGLIIKPRSRIFHGHEWVYASEIQKTLGDPQAGDLIQLKDFRDRPLGTAIFNPNSQVVARRISRRKQKLDLEFFERRAQQAIELRQRHSKSIDLNICRLIDAESDGLPGLIVDCYNEHLVLQLLTPAMVMQRDLIVAALLKLLSPRSIVLRNDSPLLVDEGVEPEITVLHGQLTEPFQLNLNGLLVEIDVFNQQSPLLPVDRIHTSKDLAPLMKDKRVLEVFCGHGVLSLSSAVAGAIQVTAVDASIDAINAVTRNAELNDVKVDALRHNPFDFLKHHDEKYDSIILNPSFLIKNKKTLNEALRNYRELHQRCLQLLNRDGVLSTFCDSHHISRDAFLHNVVQASVDAKCSLRLLRSYHQNLDHPVLPSIPETDHFKGFSFELAPSR
ncbi:class I SAM-dependent rRNA methyltransferase [Rubritalea spongiae]|uniref:Class I SAM-dependent rRNA methyltransferase n=1 Tax=Rubritalea spongiae TaxID=430797 RepID=A0ABW5E511_9BACT